jgi:hypothetical protein
MSKLASHTTERALAACEHIKMVRNEAKNEKWKVMLSNLSQMYWRCATSCSIKPILTHLATFTATIMWTKSNWYQARVFQTSARRECLYTRPSNQLQRKFLRQETYELEWLPNSTTYQQRLYFDCGV